MIIFNYFFNKSEREKRIAASDSYISTIPSVGSFVEHRLMGWKGTVTKRWTYDGLSYYVNFKVGDELQEHSVNGSEIKLVEASSNV